MNLYRISQTVNNGYDTFSDAVVCAESQDAARAIHPCGYEPVEPDRRWARIENINVELIGRAEKHVAAGVVCASFHAG